MPFNIDYSPIGSYFNLGYAGGLGQYRLAQQQLAQQRYMQQQALQYNLMSQGIAHENSMERMQISNEMDRQRQSQAQDFQIETAKLAHEWANKRHLDEMDLRKQEMQLNKENYSLNRSITESYRAGQIMDNIEAQKLKVAELEGQNWGYKNPQDLTDWETKWKNALEDKTIEGVTKAMYLADIMASRPMPTVPPPPPKEPQVKPIMDNEGNVIGHAMLEIGANGSERWVQVKAGGSGGAGSKGTPGSPGSTARLGGTGFGSTWKDHLAKADAEMQAQSGIIGAAYDMFGMRKSPFEKFENAWGAITSDSGSYTDAMNEARAQLKEEAELAAKFAPNGENAPPPTPPDLSPEAVLRRAQENVRSYVGGKQQKTEAQLALENIKANALRDAGIKEKDIIPEILEVPRPEQYGFIHSGNTWRKDGYLWNPLSDKKAMGEAFVKYLTDNADIYKNRVIGPMQTDDPALIERGGEFWSYIFDGKVLRPYAPQPPKQQPPQPPAPQDQSPPQRDISGIGSAGIGLGTIPFGF